MSKVRINDLARELEVKAKPILEALVTLGLDPDKKKTHSSSIEADEAEKVRNLLNGRRSSGATTTKAPVEAKPAFDLSHISKPGDAMRLILERKQAQEQARSAPPRPAAVAARPPVVSTAPAKPAAVVSAPAVARPPAATVVPPRRVVPQPRPSAPIVVAPPAAPAIASKPPVGPVIARPPVVVAPPATPHTAPVQAAAQPVVAPAATVPVVTAPVVVPPVTTPPAPVRQAAPVAAPAPPAVVEVATVPAVVEAPPAVEVKAESVVQAAAPAPVVEEAAATAPAPVARRVVMPQTGPRPIYTAPPGSPGGIQRGRPIFERPRPGGPPGAPGSRPPSSMAPGARRPMHPTRTFPTGTGGPGGAPGRPGFAPGGARPGLEHGRVDWVYRRDRASRRRECVRRRGRDNGAEASATRR